MSKFSIKTKRMKIVESSSVFFVIEAFLYLRFVWANLRKPLGSTFIPRNTLKSAGMRCASAVSEVLRSCTKTKIGAPIVKRIAICVIDFLIGICRKNLAMHIYRSPDTGLSFCIPNSDKSTSRRSEGGLPEMHRKPLVVTGIDNRILLDSKRDKSNRRIIWLENLRPLNSLHYFAIIPVLLLVFSGSLFGQITSGLSSPNSIVLVPNASSTGTTANTLTKLTGAPSTAVVAAISDTNGVVGVTVQNAGTSGVAGIQLNGIVSLLFDGATTAGDYVQISSSLPGYGHDAGATCPASGQTIGRVLSTNVGGGTYQVNLGANGCGGSGGGGSGIPWDTVTKLAVIGDSWTVVSTVNTNTATAASCNGTNCTITVPGTYTVGQWVNLAGNVGTYPNWSPACLNFSIVQIASVSAGVSFTFPEASSITPGRTGCTGSQSGTGGVVQDATYFMPTQTSRESYFTHGGTITPTLVNLGWPGASIVDWNTNFTSYTSGVTGPLIVISELGGSDNYCAGGIAALEAALQSLLTKWHGISGGARFIQATLQNPSTSSCAASANAWNQFIRTNVCGTSAGISTTACIDQVADYSTYAITDGTDSKYVQQTGSFINHPTDAGNQMMANVNNSVMVNKSSQMTGGTAGLGSNYFTGTNTQHSFCLDSTLCFINLGVGDGSVNGYEQYTLGIHYWINGHFPCLSNAPGGGVAPYIANCASQWSIGSNGTGWTAFGQGGTNHDATGGLQFTDYQPSTGVAPTGSCTINGVFRFAQDGTIKWCSAGTWTSFSAGGIINPMTTLGDALYGGASGTPTRLAGPTTTGHLFLFGWTPSGSAIAPTAFDFGANAATWIKGSSPIVATQNGNDVTLSCPTCGTSTPSHGVNLPLSPNGTVASPSGLLQRAPFSFTIANCYFTTTTSDGTTDLSLTLKFNGSTVSTATITHGTAAGTSTTLTVSGSTTVTAGQNWELDVTAGTTSWTGAVTCNN